jgi:septum site-determining protein MinC
VSAAALPQQSIRFRGRSFLALVLAPELPLSNWLDQVDAWASQSPGFFLSRPLVLDVTGLGLSRPDLSGLVAELAGRDIRVMGIEGTEPGALDATLPPALSGGRPAGIVEPVKARAESPVPQPVLPAEAPTPIQAAAEMTSEGQRTASVSLILEQPVRSGQSIIHVDGDVTVMGSIASGAEVIAGGSIHVYGAIRGRAIAGSLGNSGARIFCRKLEAELLAIDGLYKTADDMKPDLRGRPVQAWLEDDTIKLTVLD